MLDTLKYHLSRLLQARWVRVGGVAILTAVTAASIALLGRSIKTVHIFDGEKTFTVYSVDANVAQVLSRLDLDSEQYRILETESKALSTNVKICYAYPVYVTVGEETKTVEFLEGTVKDALLKAGIVPDENDLVEPALDTEIRDTIYIDFCDVEYVTETCKEEVLFDTKEVTYTEKIVNGVSVEKNVTDVKYLNGSPEAVTTVAVRDSASVSCISTLIPESPIELDENGIPVQYKSKMISRATAYTYTGHNCATGVAPQPGYIAVNPKVIPYGSKLYIRTPDGKVVYGYAVAADTGGFIKRNPTGVDLFMPTLSACKAFGVKNVEIYILE